MNYNLTTILSGEHTHFYVIYNSVSYLKAHWFDGAVKFPGSLILRIWNVMEWIFLALLYSSEVGLFCMVWLYCALGSLVRSVCMDAPPWI